MSTREWSYWTRNKLQILTDYLPIFTKVSQQEVRVYLDLMAGRPKNVERHTGIEFPGSPEVAMSVEPPFSHLRFCELDESLAADLESELAAQFPGDSRYQVIPGDCNSTIDPVLAGLSDVRWAPVFAFLDQQAAELHWTTIEKLARFRRNKHDWKTELWILMSPTMIAKGVRGTNAEAFQRRVTDLYGNDSWLKVQRARWDSTITAKQYRAEMVNLMRLQLERGLGYRYTHRIPMKMENGTEIYDMVFASDHDVGDRVMKSLYNKAASREPQMMTEARLARKRRGEEETGQFDLFGDESWSAGDPSRLGEELWTPEPTWDPADNDWWSL